MNRFLIATAATLLLAQPALAQQTKAVEPLTRTDGPIPAQSLARQVPASKPEISLSFAPLVKETAPAVVNVYAARQVQSRSPFAGDPFFEQFFGRGPSRPRLESSLGSGVIVDASGVVVTNNHVIDGADEVRVALADGREFDAKVLLKDERADLAVLKVDADQSFPVVQIADSDAIEIGDLVLAIGNPFGIGQTVTNGIVSALARTHIGANDFGYFIQTDAAINPGNSGGALIDMRGQLIGVNTAIFSRSGGSNGIGFAIPSNMVRAFVAAAMNGGRFERPYVGASFLPVTPDIGEALGLPRPAGALVQAVTSDGPAEQAGLRAGDVILSMNGFTIENPDTLGYRLATSGLGKSASFHVATANGERDVSIKLAAAPEKPARDLRQLRGSNPFSGATVGNLSPKLADELQLPQSKTGVVVTEIERGAPAMRVGLQPKDIIIAVNGEDIESTRQLESVLAGREWEWQFEVERDGKLLRQTIR